MVEGMLLVLLTLVAGAVGTATGFGTSTIMIPVLALIVPLPVALLFVGIIHLFGDIWKMILFRGGLQWRLVLGFGITGIVASFAGARLSRMAAEMPLKQVLGAFLLLYVVFLLVKRDWALPRTAATAAAGGALSGLFAGFFGVGGTVRGAFLAAFDLPKEVYVFTSGVIALFIDATRICTYLWDGTRLEERLLFALIACVPVSLLGAVLAKRFLTRFPQRQFRIFVCAFIGLIALKLLVWS